MGGTEQPVQERASWLQRGIIEDRKSWADMFDLLSRAKFMQKREHVPPSIGSIEESMRRKPISHVKSADLPPPRALFVRSAGGK